MFATDSAYADLLVVVVPQNGPRITGLHKKRSGVSYNLWVVTSPAKTFDNDRHIFCYLKVLHRRESGPQL